MVALDTLVQNLELEDAQLLKLDVEGHELDALHSATELLAGGHVDAIQFEFGGCHIDARTFLQDFFYLLRTSFDLYRLLRDGLRPIADYQERLEVFHTQNLVALRRVAFRGAAWVPFWRPPQDDELGVGRSDNA